MRYIQLPLSDEQLYKLATAAGQRRRTYVARERVRAALEVIAKEQEEDRASGTLAGTA